MKMRTRFRYLLAEVKSFSWIKSELRHLLVSLVIRYNSRNGVFAVEIKNSNGLGAKLEWCLEIMAYCDENGLTPLFKFSYPNSEKSEDYFGRFFRIKNTINKYKRVPLIKIDSITELDLGKNYDDILDIELATYLINKYLVVEEDIINEVECFCHQYFANSKVLGVHFRGTDKIEESPVVPYDRVKRNINHYLKLFPETDSIFIASDDIIFIENMQKTPIGRPIIFRNDSFRSRDGKAIHGAAHTDKYEINRDAIINCLILSRCNALLKTASTLSAWSKLFNPQLPVVMLNEPYYEHLWFPEKVLIGRNLFEPIK